ncbi:membrane protein [Sphingomonas sp. PAMC 26605]|uniref:membrane protein n=1 Tax=Sphingomonas sp. PAMC 26605 TaxID=1112214 RepID=UPI00026CC5C1|nr:membrane protein [Sphingomonas sp. PAMC 26605]
MRIWIGIGMGLLLAACGKPAPQQAPSASAQAPQAPQIRIAQVGGTVFAATVGGSGKVAVRAAEGVPGATTPKGASNGYSLLADLSAADAARVTLGAGAQIRFPAFQNDVVVGRVVKIASPQDGNAVVEITLPRDSRFAAGQAANARIIAKGAGTTMLAVPPSAILGPHTGAAAVYVVDLATARVQRRAVTLGAQTSDGIGVSAGLQKGEWVALTRVDQLHDGMKIAPVGPS